MRRGKESKTLFLALVTLREVADRAYHEPIEPSFAIRLALAVAFEHGDGDRRHFDSFWRHMQERHEFDPSKAGYIRGTRLRGCLYQIQDITAWGVAPEDNHVLDDAWRDQKARINGRLATSEVTEADAPDPNVSRP